MVEKLQISGYLNVAFVERGINKPKPVKKSLTSHIRRFRCINRVISDHDCALHVFPIIILAETEIDGNGKVGTET